jgi:penicillin-binding protein 1A
MAGLSGIFEDLPEYATAELRPPVMTQVHASDARCLRIQRAPPLSADPAVEACDQRVHRGRRQISTNIQRRRHRHGRAAVYVQNYGGSRRPQGASTITQQVAKNFLLTNELSVARKVKEALLALRIERTYSKDKILELYLNQIYLGLGAYGVAAASLLYYDKSVHELSIAEAAYLAALPKGPNNYNPFRRRDEAIARRNYVIDRMVEDG